MVAFILLACESGTTFFSGSGIPDLAKPLLQYGARGVIVSEAELPTDTAVYFGKYFLEGLIKNVRLRLRQRRLARTALFDSRNDERGVSVVHRRPIAIVVF